MEKYEFESDHTDESRRERRHASSCARRRQPLFFFAAQGRKLSLSASPAWAEGALKCHPRNSDGGAAWAYPLCFGLSLGSRAVWKNAIATAMFFFEAPPPGYAVLWSVCVGAACAPVAIRRGSRFIASVVVVDKAQTADGSPRGRQSNSKQVFLDFLVNWIESNFPLAPKWKCLLGYSFFWPIRSKKFNWILFFFSSLKRAPTTLWRQTSNINGIICRRPYIW